MRDSDFLKSLQINMASRFDETIDFSKIKDKEKVTDLLQKPNRQFNNPIIQKVSDNKLNKLRLTNSMHKYKEGIKELFALARTPENQNSMLLL
jgi:hypothetical protein